MNTFTSSTTSQSHPQIAESKSRVRVWLKRILWLVIGIGSLAAIGMVYQLIATAIDQRAFLPPGQMIDVGDYRMHLNCTGTNVDGNPTVILEPGLGATSSAWAWIQPAVAKTTRVCAYDRAGMGWSDPSPAPRNTEQIAEELHTLLQNAQIPGPYVLVGWSIGGLYVRAYADQYPNQVAGLVLLDSSSPEQCTSTPGGQAQCASTERIYSIAPVLARLGVMRLMGLRQPASGLPTPQNEALLASFSATKDWDTQSAEYVNTLASKTPALTSESLGAVPLFILTATDHGTPPDLEQLWQGWQSGFMALSTNSVQRVLPDSTHTSLVFDATDAKASVDAILQVVEASRTGAALK